MVTIPTGTATFFYDADGTKWRKTDVLGGATTNTDYIRGIQYDGPAPDTLDFIQTEEGKAFRHGSTYEYVYYLGDNLGNTRITFGTKNGVSHPNVYQQDDYYPFGLEILRTSPGPNPKNEYLYNKKELQEEFGEYDYGARFYDPVVVHWNTIDPMAEMSRRFSTYSYVLDNPIRFIDVDGMVPGEYYDKNGKPLGADENGNRDDKVRIVTDETSIATIKANDKAKTYTNSASVTSEVVTSKTELKEAKEVLNGSKDVEQSSIVSANGNVTKLPPGSADHQIVNGKEVATSSEIELPDRSEGATYIHGHTTATPMVGDDLKFTLATQPGPNDPGIFSHFASNIIVGNLEVPSTIPQPIGLPTVVPPTKGAVFYNTADNSPLSITLGALNNIIKK